jgi:ribose-phosphate pyrophosphokinase
VVVHALFAPGALRRLATAGVARVVSTDTVAHPSNAIGVAPLLAAAVRSRPGRG